MVNRSSLSNRARSLSSLVLTLPFCVVLLVGSGCETSEQRGPAEEVGKEIDRLVDQAKISAEDAAKEVDGSVEKLRKRADEASQALKEKVSEIDHVVTTKIKELTEREQMPADDGTPVPEASEKAAE